LTAEDSSGPTLTLKAVAHWNPYRRTLTHDLQFSAATRCATSCH